MLPTEKNLREMAVQAPDKYAQAGFTLLEVMAAIAILGIGIVMIIQLFSGSLKEGSANGVTEGGLAWAVEVSPYELKKVEGAESKVFKVVVSAEGQGPRKKTYTLTTLKAVF